MEAEKVAGYTIRILGGLAGCLITVFASRAWAATLVIAGAITVCAAIAAVLLPSPSTDAPRRG